MQDLTESICDVKPIKLPTEDVLRVPVSSIHQPVNRTDHFNNLLCKIDSYKQKPRTNRAVLIRRARVFLKKVYNDGLVLPWEFYYDEDDDEDENGEDFDSFSFKWKTIDGKIIFSAIVTNQFYYGYRFTGTQGNAQYYVKGRRPHWYDTLLQFVRYVIY